MKTDWRLVADVVMPLGVTFLLAYNGAGWWALLVVLYGIWEFREGRHHALAQLNEAARRVNALAESANALAVEAKKIIDERGK